MTGTLAAPRPGEAETLPPESAIVIEGMVKRYGHVTAVNHLSMRVPRGSIYGFIGPNGAGKSTTIRTLATLQRPDAGKITVQGIDVLVDPRSVRACVGYLPDVSGVYDNLTVGEYLEFCAASHQIPAGRRQRLCDELLELVDLADKRGVYAATLSRGLKQRLGMARCLVHDPEVLLLDEPGAGMDPRARIELREILRELRKLNKTILLGSHVLSELAEVCTDVGIIRGGEIIAEGPVDAVLTALSAGPRLHVRVLQPQDCALVRSILASDGRFGEPEREDEHTVEAPFVGATGGLAEILATLLNAGIPVSGFALRHDTLEDVFLQVTELDAEEV